MDIFDRLVPYLEEPLLLVGIVMLVILVMAQRLFKPRMSAPFPLSTTLRILRFTLNYGFVLAFVLVAMGGYLLYVEADAGP